MTSRKKIYDITPLKETKDVEEPKEKPRVILEARPKSPLSPSGLRRTKQKTGKNLRIILAGIVLLLASLSSYLLIPHKAKADLWPAKKSAEATTTAIVSSVQSGESFIQGNIIELEKVVSQDFESEGRKLKTTKAQGAIKVYNNYSTASQTLLANTRFISNDGKLFRIPKRLVVPGGHYESGKFIAGVIDTQVLADQPGSEYNIEASTFSIPGFVGTPKYTSFYAKSFESMKGGAKEEVPYISKEDLDRAQEALKNLAMAENDAALKNAADSQQYILIEGAFLLQAEDFQASVKLGQETGTFSAQMKAKAKAIVFREEALRNFSIGYIQKNFLPEEKLIESSLQIEHTLEKADLAKGELALKIRIWAKKHSAPSEIAIKEMIKGKPIEEIENIFKVMPQIDKVEVEFWPFWANLAPDGPDMIEVVMHLDAGVD